MTNIFLFISLAFLFTFLVGKLLEKIRVPWIFAALILGSLLAIYNPFKAVTSSETFTFLANLGMYFLLFIVGFELNVREVKKQSEFLLKSTFFIIFLEAIFGTLLIHFVFGYAWLMSGIVALSFATVGEAILIPILDEFKIINTKLGQTIIGVGTLDDLIEIFILLIVIIMIGTQANGNVFSILIALASIFLMTIVFTKFGHSGRRFAFMNIETLFLFSLFVFFLFIGIGIYAEATPLAALLAGISLRTFVPRKRLKTIENEIKAMAYGFFAPLFFISVGSEMDISYIISFPLLILLVVFVSNSAKLLGSYIMAKKELGTKGSILLGIGLSVRFSTSIVIIKILFDSKLIGMDLYSVIVASSIVFKFIVPVLFSNLLVRWKFAKA